MTMMRQGRQAGTDRRRQRVISALKTAVQNGSPISVSGTSLQKACVRIAVTRSSSRARSAAALLCTCSDQPGESG